MMNFNSKSETSWWSCSLLREAPGRGTSCEISNGLWPSLCLCRQHRVVIQVLACISRHCIWDLSLLSLVTLCLMSQWVCYEATFWQPCLLITGAASTKDEFSPTSQIETQMRWHVKAVGIFPSHLPLLGDLSYSQDFIVPTGSNLIISSLEQD